MKEDLKFKELLDSQQTRMVLTEKYPYILKVKVYPSKLIGSWYSEEIHNSELKVRVGTIDDAKKRYPSAYQEIIENKEFESGFYVIEDRKRFRRWLIAVKHAKIITKS